MRFAHLSDSHLGLRQLGSIEREEDFYEVFEKTIDKIIELDVDFVIHSGDLFEKQKPSPEALIAFQSGLLRLNDANIPIYAIAGNHDSIFRKNAKPALVLFKQLGLNLISFHNNEYVKDDVLICGIPGLRSSKKEALIEILNELSERANNYSKSILVLHQGITKFLPKGVGELKLSELPKNFDYYAMGHLHDYIVVDFSEEGYDDYGEGILVYPGSMELYKINDNYLEFGKGFCVVDISGEKPIVERIKIDLKRELFEISIDYNSLEEELKNFKNSIIGLEKKPVVNLVVEGSNFESSGIYETIQNELKDHVLNLTIKIKQNNDSKRHKFDPEKSLDPRSVLTEEVNKAYNKQEYTDLCVDLFEMLSDSKIEEAKELSSDFFKQYFSTITDEHNGEEIGDKKEVLGDFEKSLDNFKEV